MREMLDEEGGKECKMRCKGSGKERIIKKVDKGSE
jgi:hypothetical protein